MKLISKYLDKERCGHMVMIPDEGEDMWHTYNLIREGDRLRSSTIRKVQQESATGSSSSSRVRTTLTIQVETTDFDIGACLLSTMDAQSQSKENQSPLMLIHEGRGLDSVKLYVPSDIDHKKKCILWVKGRNVQENKYIKMGAYHTLDLEPNRKFTLFKEEWDSVMLERVDNACDPSKHADLAAVVMQEGLAFVCLITSAMTIDRAKIDVNIPKKGKADDTQRKKATIKFFDLVLAAILRHLNFEIVKAVVIASPGFVKDQFFEHMNKIAVQTDNKLLIENKSKFVLCHSSNGFKHSLREVLENPAVAVRLSDTKAAGETKALQQFMTMLGTDPDRAFYGLKHVTKANESLAIETLLVSDTLFRSKELNERKMYVRLVDNVRDNGGDVKIFSSLHLSGEQLDQMTGVAALLRFPMPEIEEEEHDLDSDND